MVSIDTQSRSVVAVLALFVTIAAHQYEKIIPDTVVTPCAISSVVVDSIPHPYGNGLHIYFYRPAVCLQPLPTVFFCHGIGATDPRSYSELIAYVVKNNVCVCYATYEATNAILFPLLSYTQLWRGMVAGHRKWKQYIDDERIGFIGHSYGGGAVPSMAWRAVHRKKWGAKGLFLYTMAPWFCHGMNSKRFSDFPEHTIFVTQVYKNDYVNDWRIADDQFRSFAIAAERKCFISVFPAKNDTGYLPARHCLPVTSCAHLNLGRYVVSPVVDSLIQYAFRENYETQLGRTRNDQMRHTGDQNGLHCTFYKGNSCAFTCPQSRYLNFWGHAMNPRFKGTRLMPPPIRICVQTPQTILRYGAFAIGQMAK